MGDLTTLANAKQYLNVTGLPIASITNANPAKVTLAQTPGYPLLSGGTYSIENVTGMAGVGGSYAITVATPTSFTIPIDTTTAGTYTGGGIVGVSDPLLSRLISAASQYLETQMSRTIETNTYLETRNGLGGNVMTLLNGPVVNVNSLTIDGIVIPPRPALGSGSYSSFSPGGWVNDSERIMVQGYCFNRGFMNITVNYTAGFASVPADLEQCCIDLLSEWFMYRNRIGKLSESIEGQSITFGKQMISEKDFDILNGYKRVSPIY